MTPDELRALADGDGRGVYRGKRWLAHGVKVEGEYVAVMAGGDVAALTTREAEARLVALAPVLACDHADLLDWAERAAVLLTAYREEYLESCCEFPRWPTSSAEESLRDFEAEHGGDVLSEWDAMKERP